MPKCMPERDRTCFWLAGRLAGGWLHANLRTENSESQSVDLLLIEKRACMGCLSSLDFVPGPDCAAQVRRAELCALPPPANGRRGRAHTHRIHAVGVACGGIADHALSEAAPRHDSVLPVVLQHAHGGEHGGDAILLPDMPLRAEHPAKGALYIYAVAPPVGCRS
jgi:hypothetical protein